MKILFVYPSNDISYPLQVGALSAYVKQYGHQTKLVNLFIKDKLSEEHFLQIKNEVEKFKPQFIGLSCYETAFSWVKEIIGFVKDKWPKIRTIVGGYYPTLCPQDVIAIPSIDVICRGEGEEALKELLESHRNTKIKNLWFKKNGRIIKNPIRPLIENLDKLPFPDKEMFDYQTHLNVTEKKGERIVKIMASRGCPFECTYCCNKYIRELYPNKKDYLRLRSPENVIEEIRYLKKNFKFEKVGFHDDNLTLDAGWLKKFCGLYGKQVGLPFYCAARVESCSEEVLDLLKEAGCYMLLLGVESGDEEYRRKVMKRYMTNKTIVEVFRKARQHGILTWSFTMVGLPYETRKMILKTLSLNWRCRPDFVMASIFYPFKGTQLGNICYEKGWVNFEKKNSVTSYAWESVLKHPNLSVSQIKMAKYLNSLTALRSKFFWEQFLSRVKDSIKYGRKL